MVKLAEEDFIFVEEAKAFLMGKDQGKILINAARRPN